MKVATEDSEEAFSGQTVPLDIEESDKVQKTVIANSRKKFATARVKVEEQMEALFSEDDTTKEKKQITTTKRKDTKTTESKLHGL